MTFRVQTIEVYDFKFERLKPESETLVKENNFQIRNITFGLFFIKK